MYLHKLIQTLSTNIDFYRRPILHSLPDIGLADVTSTTSTYAHRAVKSLIVGSPRCAPLISRGGTPYKVQ